MDNGDHSYRVGLPTPQFFSQGRPSKMKSTPSPCRGDDLNVPLGDLIVKALNSKTC